MPYLWSRRCDQSISSSRMKKSSEGLWFSEGPDPFQALLDYLEGGETLDEFLDDFPTFSRDGAVAALEFAKSLLVGQIGMKVLLDVFLMLDKGIQYQQNMVGRSIGILIVRPEGEPHSGPVTTFLPNRPFLPQAATAPGSNLGRGLSVKCRPGL